MGKKNKIGFNDLVKLELRAVGEAALVSIKHDRPATQAPITIATITDRHGQTFIGISRCSEKDNFSRKLGRQIAFGRALHAFKQEIMRAEVQNRYVPPPDIRPAPTPAPVPTPPPCPHSYVDEGICQKCGMKSVRDGWIAI